VPCAQSPSSKCQKDNAKQCAHLAQRCHVPDKKLVAGIALSERSINHIGLAELTGEVKLIVDNLRAPLTA
jgi:hypothetical protein